MKIIDIIERKRKQKEPTLSFEIFPPKSQNPLDITTIAVELAKLSPDFISVTYGAGGSTQDKTIEISGMIKQQYQIETVSHLTCISFTKNQIADTAQDFKNQKIENILALRGDLPNDPNYVFPTPLHFEHSSDLVEFLKSKFDFNMGGAFYPEGHPENKDLKKELYYTLKKIDSGMDFLISQLFFDNNHFYRARKEIREKGYETPLLAGIMPIISFSQIDRLIKLTGCQIPDTIQKIIKTNENNPKNLFDEGLNFTVNQIDDLIENGVDGIHLYTMNNPEITKQLINRSKLRNRL